MRFHPTACAFLALVAAGCSSDRSTDPGQQDDGWSLVRLHEQAPAGGYQDLSVQPDGSLWLEDGRSGDRSSSRGLLAGERLETLARLIDDLPRRSYSDESQCVDGTYFISVTRGGEVTTFATNVCDLEAPRSLSPVRETLAMVAEEVTAPRFEAVPFRVLAVGETSRIGQARRIVVESRDALLRLLEEHNPTAPIALPQVDFRQQVVIARFLGAKPSGGFGVDVEFVERTETGWLRVEYAEQAPTSDCGVSLAPTQPFVLIAVERPDGGFLFESRTIAARCD